MENNATEPAAEKRQLKPETRDKYLRALNDLVGSLSINKSKAVNVEEFCQLHQTKVSFFEALRDLDALVFDFSKSGIDEAYYRSTEKLFKITPEQVVGRMRGLGGLVSRATAEEPAAAVDAPPTEEAARKRRGPYNRKEKTLKPGQSVVNLTEDEVLTIPGNSDVGQLQLTTTISPCGPVGDTLLADNMISAVGLPKGTLEALNYLADKLSLDEFRRVDPGHFGQCFPEHIHLLHFLVSIDMLEESDAGVYPMFRITPKLTVAIQQKTFNPVMPVAQTTESAEEITEVAGQTMEPATLTVAEAMRRLQCPSEDCANSICLYCADDSEKRVRLMGQLAAITRESTLEKEYADTKRLLRVTEEMNNLRPQSDQAADRLHQRIEQLITDVQNQAATMAGQIAGQPGLAWPGTIGRGSDLAVLALANPYNIDIEADGLRLNMNVRTTEDADIVDALLFKLNRKTVPTV